MALAPRNAPTIGAIFANEREEGDALLRFLDEARQTDTMCCLVGTAPGRIREPPDVQTFDANGDMRAGPIPGTMVCTWRYIWNQILTEAAVETLVARLRAGRDRRPLIWCTMSEDRGADWTVARYQAWFVAQVAQRDCTVVCSYNLSGAGATVFIDTLRAHPLVLTRDSVRCNPFFYQIDSARPESGAVADLRRANRDLITLSMLTPAWHDRDPACIIDDLGRSLASVAGADFVGAIGLNDAEHHDLHTAYASPGLPGSADLAQAVAAWAADIPPEAVTNRVAIVDSPAGAVRIVSVPIGIKSRARLVAASHAQGFPTQEQRTLLRLGANLATIAIDRWRAETEQQRLVALVENSGDFIGVADLHGAPLYLNPAGRKLVGLDAMAPIRHLHILDFVVPEQRAHMRDECWPIVTSTGRWQGELRVRNFQTSGAIPLLIDWFLINDKRPGHPIVMATVSRDLTVQKQSEAELRRLSESLEAQVLVRTRELAEANERLRAEARERRLANARLQGLQSELLHAARHSTAGEVAGVLAHELGQPLGAAINYINIASRVLSSRDNDRIGPAASVLDHAAAQVLRATGIMDRLWDFIVGGNPHKRPESVSDLVDEAITLALTDAASQDIALVSQIASDLPLVLVDKIQVQQVLVNIVRNAVEAMAGSDRRELRVTVVQCAVEAVCISVADSGPGISGSVADRLFQPFVSSKHNGMGLGLAVCRSIIQAHGGLLWHELQPGWGAVFCFTISVAGADVRG